MTDADRADRDISMADQIADPGADPDAELAGGLDRALEHERTGRLLRVLGPAMAITLTAAALLVAHMPLGAPTAPTMAAVAAAAATSAILAWRGHQDSAALLLVVAGILSPALRSLATGHLGTNGAYFGVAGVVGLMLLPWRLRWWVTGGTLALLLAVILRTDTASSLPVVRSETLVSGALLTILTLITGLLLLRGYSRMIDRALAAKRVALRSAASLETLNGSLEEAVAEREAQLAAAIEARQAVAEQLADTVIRDPLTDLLNRRFLDQELARFSQSPAAVAILDVDNFKQINDAYSYLVGDDVLKGIARCLARHTRPGDVVVRYGGEEFAVLMPSTTAAGARAGVESLRAAVAAHDWSAIQPDLQVTVSAGVCATGEATTTGEHLLSCADSNVRAAKSGGRDRTVVTTCDPQGCSPDTAQAPPPQ